MTDHNSYGTTPECRELLQQRHERAVADRDAFLDSLAKVLVKEMKESSALLQHFAVEKQAPGSLAHHALVRSVVASVESAVNPLRVQVAEGWSLVRLDGPVGDTAFSQVFRDGTGAPLVVVGHSLMSIGIDGVYLVPNAGIVAEGWLTRVVDRD